MLGTAKKILTMAIFITMAIPFISIAQIKIDTSYSLSNELGVEMYPTYPRPNEDLSISLSLYTADLNSAMITWYKDGKSVLSGKGETKYSFRMGKVGQEVKISIQIKLQSGASFSKNFTLNPASVDLVWEANSYVPPFYKGKALHSYQGSFKVVAMPEFVKNGKRVAPGNLVYNWSNGVNAYQSKSGYGKNTIVLDGSLLGKTEEIQVVVTDPAGSMTAQGFVDISPVDPEVVFYINDPYYGYIYDSAAPSSFELSSEEIQVVAAPYFFSSSSFESLSFNWRLNGEKISSLSDSMTAVFRKPSEGSGESNVSLSVENGDKILQQAERNLVMNYKN